MLKQPPGPVKGTVEDGARRHTKWDNKRALKKRREGVKEKKKRSRAVPGDILATSKRYPQLSTDLSTKSSHETILLFKNFSLTAK